MAAKALPPYLCAPRPDVLSRLINEHFEMNFNDFINGHRVKIAQNLLTDPVSAQEKIATIAYDCGFKSVSAFNSAFKKVANQTPSQFRDGLAPAMNF